LTRVGYSPAGLNSIFSFLVVRIADEHLRQTGVSASKPCADAILPKTPVLADFARLACQIGNPSGESGERLMTEFRFTTSINLKLVARTSTAP